MIRGNRNNMITIRHKILKRRNLNKMHRITQRMYAEPVNQHRIVKCLFHGFIPIYMQNPLCIMPKMLMTVNQLCREKVVHMGMCNQKVPDLPQIHPVGQCVGICIRRKINQQAAVYHCLRPRAQFFSPYFPCPFANLTATEKSRPPFRRCCT